MQLNRSLLFVELTIVGPALPNNFIPIQSWLHRDTVVIRTKTVKKGYTFD